MRALLPCLLLTLTACGAAAPAPRPEPQAVAVLDALLAALARPDEASQVAALVPLAHATLLTDDRADLADLVKRYALKKASANAAVYVRPPVVVELRDEGPGREGGEPGRRARYFLQKKPGVDGMPAPVTLFWPDAGGPPRVLNFGGL